MKQQKIRNKEIDYLKGLSIILVVVGHAIQYNICDYNVNPFFNIIYSFHMPLFMFISGYVAFLTIDIKGAKDGLNLVIKK